MAETDLKGSVALVTGGSLGIGRATCVALARAGALVAVNYHLHIEEADQVVRAVRDSGSQAIKIQADVADQAAVDAMVGQVVERFGKLDIAIGNAAYSDREPFVEAEMAGFRRTVDVTMWGAFPPDTSRRSRNDPPGGWRRHRAGQLAPCHDPGGRLHGLQHGQGGRRVDVQDSRPGAGQIPDSGQHHPTGLDRYPGRTQACLRGCAQARDAAFRGVDSGPRTKSPNPYCSSVILATSTRPAPHCWSTAASVSPGGPVTRRRRKSIDACRAEESSSRSASAPVPSDAIPGRSMRYLLPCSCGQSVGVEFRQAGGQVRCACGRVLEVPSLRTIRQLEPEVAPPGRRGRASILVADSRCPLCPWPAAAGLGPGLCRIPSNPSAPIADRGKRLGQSEGCDGDHGRLDNRANVGGLESHA